MSTSIRTVIVGSGPVGTLCGLMLARRGHEVTLVDRDPGPVGDRKWDRRGVMQYDLPHFFRPAVRAAIVEEVPELWTALLLAGGLPARPPGFPEAMTGLQCRRSTFEPVLWTFADSEPRVRRVTGSAGRLTVDAGRVTGVTVGEHIIEADLVVVATGRSGHLGDELRAPGQGGPCGFGYAARQYRARPGAPLPDWGMPRYTLYDGYETIVFPQDAQTLTALIVRPTADPRLRELRRSAAFEAAAAAIPSLAPWTGPAGYEPISDVRAGSNLRNDYRGQRGEEGRAVPGVVFLGDAVCSTNPAGGRGVALGMQQARELVRLLDEHGIDDGVGEPFDDWCSANVRPWFEDHVEWDASRIRRFAGEDLDLEGRIPPDIVCECAQVDPSIMAAAGPYLGLLALPTVLDTVQDKARAVLRTGWRPPYAAGPDRDRLAELALSAAA